MLDNMVSNVLKKMHLSGVVFVGVLLALSLHFSSLVVLLLYMHGKLLFVFWMMVLLTVFHYSPTTIIHFDLNK